MTGTLETVNVGEIRAVRLPDRIVTTGIWKFPVEGRVAVRGVNLDGDDQADRTVHGGPDKAVYAYSGEDTDWWSEQLGRELEPGTFGENLSTRGVDVSGAIIGERWRVGSTLLEVCQPRLPCFKLGIKMGDPRFLRRFGRAGRPGAYLRIIEEGDVGAGDAVEIVDRPEHDVTSRLVSDAILVDHTLLPRLLDAPALAEDLIVMLAERVRRKPG